MCAAYLDSRGEEEGNMCEVYLDSRGEEEEVDEEEIMCVHISGLTRRGGGGEHVCSIPGLMW